MAAEAGSRRGAAARRKAKEVAVGAAARVLFYPTLLYNVVRSKVQAEFRWWDEVDQVRYWLSPRPRPPGSSRIPS
jgi:atypical dual specificity phosphatase